MDINTFSNTQLSTSADTDDIRDGSLNIEALARPNVLFAASSQHQDLAERPVSTVSPRNERPTLSLRLNLRS